MDKREDYLSGFVLRKGEKLFGKDFRVEEMRNQISEKELDKLRDFAPFYKIHIPQIIGGDNKFTEAEMYIMQTVDGKEVFVCNSGGYLRKNTFQKLRKEKKCFMGIRNNRIGYRGDYETKLGTWQRINYFSSQNKACVGLFLEELSAFRDSSKEEIRYPDVEIDDFCACVWKTIQDTFNPSARKELKVEYYPSFNSKDEDAACYDTFIIWLSKEEESPFYVQIRRFPNYQEFICVNPGKYWRIENRNQMSSEMRERYDKKMLEMESSFIKALYRIDRKSVLLMGGDDTFPYVQVGEVRTSNPKVVEIFCKKLREYRDNYQLKKEIQEDIDSQYRKNIHYNFF
ncbi:MAG: hypothetical protein IJ958_03755 [Agathobacter sp.]|nr:hypothetical protein [Agathobacter sp.]